jgi:hypothetical protein
VRSTAAPYTESRLTRSVANERVGFPVVEHVQFINIFCTFGHLALCLFKLFYWSFARNCDRLGINFQPKKTKKFIDLWSRFCVSSTLPCLVLFVNLNLKVLSGHSNLGV